MYGNQDAWFYYMYPCKSWQKTFSRIVKNVDILLQSLIKYIDQQMLYIFPCIKVSLITSKYTSVVVIAYQWTFWLTTRLPPLMASLKFNMYQRQVYTCIRKRTSHYLPIWQFRTIMSVSMQYICTIQQNLEFEDFF
jgi:hypothetical protein